MASLPDLIEKLKYPSQEKTELISRAYYFAEKAHQGQKRYSGEPYFNHAVETAMILADLGMGRRTISAALLHDVLEDAHVSAAELERHFGKEITFLVEGVTKLGTVRYQGEERDIESLRKFFVATSSDIRVLVIKLADRLHNMRTLEYVPEKKRSRIAMETMQIYVPIAYRLGMRGIKREMEDLAFKYLDQKRYHEIREAITKRGVKKEEMLEKFRRAVLRALAENDITGASSDMRLKSIYSIHRKAEVKKRDFDQIFDLYALRIQLGTTSDCYKALGIIHSMWRPLPGRIKDYIAFPKPNSYQSLHTTVFTGDGSMLEIQIRTHEMHRHAELGLAGHIAYKDNENPESPKYKWFKQLFSRKKTALVAKVKIDTDRVEHIPQWIKELVDVQSFLTISTEFMDSLKNDFFEHRMFIFDPKGGVIDLPVGSSVVDYAYTIDLEGANNLFGARVNDKHVSLDTVLKNGDIVEIQTRQHAHPTQKWLEYCKTASAKLHVRRFLDRKK